MVSVLCCAMLVWRGSYLNLLPQIYPQRGILRPRADEDASAQDMCCPRG